mmetsp:Transcript_1641/g.4986  ORF Transcript_1641/g.4986 Transcript_1641/m.4986 type:complete len:200 (+) Transcript_1641:697-1296(+)
MIISKRAQCRFRFDSKFSTSMTAAPESSQTCSRPSDISTSSFPRSLLPSISSNELEDNLMLSVTMIARVNLQQASATQNPQIYLVHMSHSITLPLVLSSFPSPSPFGSSSKLPRDRLRPTHLNNRKAWNSLFPHRMLPCFCLPTTCFRGILGASTGAFSHAGVAADNLHDNIHIDYLIFLHHLYHLYLSTHPLSPFPSS